MSKKDELPSIPVNWDPFRTVQTIGRWNQTRFDETVQTYEKSTADVEVIRRPALNQTPIKKQLRHAREQQALEKQYPRRKFPLGN